MCAKCVDSQQMGDKMSLRPEVYLWDPFGTPQRAAQALRGYPRMLLSPGNLVQLTKGAPGNDVRNVAATAEQLLCSSFAVCHWHIGPGICHQSVQASRSKETGPQGPRRNPTDNCSAPFGIRLVQISRHLPDCEFSCLMDSVLPWRYSVQGPQSRLPRAQ